MITRFCVFVKLLIYILLLILTGNISAEVIIDGSLNPNYKNTTLKGTFNIEPKYGTIKGNNLFHSFKEFNIDQNESATFIAPEGMTTINNVISRVTGNNQSIIDGQLISNIPNFFLLNPNGVIIGEHASLNVKGSFHISTADYLVMDDKFTYYCKVDDSLLSIGNPVAFGFFDDNTGDISITGNKEYDNSIEFEEGNSIELEDGCHLSIVGGKILIDHTYISAPGGKINIVSTKQNCEIDFINIKSNNLTPEQRSLLTISNYSAIDVSGDASGDINILAGGCFITNGTHLMARTEGGLDGGMTYIDVVSLDVLNKSHILSEIGYCQTDTFEETTGGKVLIKAYENINFSNYSSIMTSNNFFNVENTKKFNAGSITLIAENIFFSNMSLIESNTAGTGDGGDILLIAQENMNASDNSFFLSNTIYKGNAGNITINAKNIILEKASGPGAQTEGIGNAGNISLFADESIVLRGNNAKGRTTVITNFSSGAGNAGNVELTANYILFQDGARIVSGTDQNGDGGNITINTNNGTIEMIGVNPYGENDEGFNSGLSSESTGNGAAGNINIDTGELFIKDGALISNSTTGEGNSGEIYINSGQIQIKDKAEPIDPEKYLESQLFFHNYYDESEKNYLSGIYSRTEGKTQSNKEGGQIIIDSSDLFISDHGTISSSSSGKRNAGNIDIAVNNIFLNFDASITSESLAEEEGGMAGRITINAEKSMHIENESSITTEAVNTTSSNETSDNGKIILTANHNLRLLNSKVTSSVHSGMGKGGDININADFIVQNHGKILANAFEGSGGNISILSNYYIKSTDSTVDASSERGIDGIVKVEHLDSNLDDSITSLPDDYLDASKWIKDPCVARTNENESFLIVKQRDILPASPFDLMASPLPYFEDMDFDYFVRGDFQKAILKWEQAVNTFEKSSQPYFQTSIYLANAYNMLGYCNKSISIIVNAFEYAGDQPYYKILFYNSLGVSYFSLNDLKNSKKYFQLADNHARLIKDSFLIASILNNMGNFYVKDKSDHNKRFLQAMRSYFECITIINDNPKMIRLEINALINVARCSLINGNIQIASAVLEKSLSLIQLLPENYHKSMSLISASQLIQTIQDNNKTSDPELTKLIHKLLNEARLIAASIKNSRVFSYACGFLGQLYEAQKMYADATKITQLAIFSAQSKSCPEVEYLWQWQLGRLFETQENINSSLTAYKHALNAINPIRYEFLRTNRIESNFFFKYLKPVYLEMSTLFMNYPFLATKKQDHLIEARDTLELLKKLELQNFFKDECAIQMEKNRKISKLNRTPKHTALIYPISFSDKVVLLVSLPDGIKKFEKIIDANQLKEKIDGYLDKLHQAKSEVISIIYFSRFLYDCLIKPLEQELAKQEVDTLIIAPDGILRRVPFSALHDGKQYLIQKFALVLIPGITLTDPEPINKDTLSAIMFGLTESVQKHRELPNVDDELNDIQKIAGGEIFLNNDFNIENLKNTFKNSKQMYSIVHMATHGNFGSTPDETYILTFDGRLKMKDLKKLIRYGKYKNKQMDLLTLSACQTALGDERAALGLAGVAINAGARSVLASLWLLDDKASSLAMKYFYQALIHSNFSKAKALQYAQNMLLKHNQYNHPAFWAPFVLIGNWL